MAIGACLMRGLDVHDSIHNGMDAVRALGLDPRLLEACDRAISDAVPDAPSERDGGDTASETLRLETLRTVAPDATAWSALPVDLVSQHELAWVLDNLARDAVTQLTDSPGGSEYVEARDPNWRIRYPGT